MHMIIYYWAVQRYFNRKKQSINRYESELSSASVNKNNAKIMHQKCKKCVDAIHINLNWEHAVVNLKNMCTFCSLWNV